MMSSPMTAEGHVIGALNLYSRDVDAFDTEAASLAEVVAAHAGLATQVGAAFYGHRDLAEQLAEAMQSRGLIEQAKGVILTLRSCSPEEAWDELVRLSQNANRKVRDIAEAIIEQASKGQLTI